MRLLLIVMGLFILVCATPACKKDYASRYTGVYLVSGVYSFTSYLGQDTTYAITNLKLGIAAVDEKTLAIIKAGQLLSKPVLNSTSDPDFADCFAVSGVENTHAYFGYIDHSTTVCFYKQDPDSVYCEYETYTAPSTDKTILRGRRIN